MYDVKTEICQNIHNEDERRREWTEGLVREINQDHNRWLKELTDLIGNIRHSSIKQKNQKIAKIKSFNEQMGRDQ